MSDFNTFTGKTVDEAIGEACRFFATERDKLEVEIISGGSTGIFGLVGKKKAQVRARRRQDPAVAALIREEERREAEKARAAQARTEERPRSRQAGNGADRDEAPAERETGQARSGNGSGASSADASDRDSGEPAMAGEADESGNGQRRQGNRRGRGRRGRDQGSPDGETRQARQGNGDGNGRSRPEKSDGTGVSDARTGQDRSENERRRAEKPRPAPRPRAEESDDDLPDTCDATPASPELIALASEIMSRLLTPILEQEPAMEIEGTAGRLSVLIRDEEHSGLLIGREGQTLAALQYLANRILARRWETPVRVQVNTGEYREKQDDNLRRMAAFLADKARNLGRPQSTKPLSSYHRRVIHLALQGDETIQTRSKGDGPMKRVIIVPRRPKPAEQPPAQ